MGNDDSQASSVANEESKVSEASKQEPKSDSSCRLGDELKEVRQCYDDMRHKAVEGLKSARETTLGDVLDGVTSFVKRHPRCSLGIAAVLGFFIGRMFRR
jgi:ElaB/YqjD/DUF883 family membrane-anchored ribosome-binding protein